MDPAVLEGGPVLGQAQDEQPHVVLLPTAEAEPEAPGASLQLHRVAAQALREGRGGTGSRGRSLTAGGRDLPSGRTAMAQGRSGRCGPSSAAFTNAAAIGGYVSPLLAGQSEQNFGTCFLEVDFN